MNFRIVIILLAIIVMYSCKNSENLNVDFNQCEGKGNITNPCIGSYDSGWGFVIFKQLESKKTLIILVKDSIFNTDEYKKLSYDLQLISKKKCEVFIEIASPNLISNPLSDIKIYSEEGENEPSEIYPITKGDLNIEIMKTSDTYPYHCISYKLEDFLIPKKAGVTKTYKSIECYSVKLQPTGG